MAIIGRKKEGSISVLTFDLFTFWHICTCFLLPSLGVWCTPYTFKFKFYKAGVLSTNLKSFIKLKVVDGK